MNRASQKNKTERETKQKRLFWSLSCISLFFAVFYIFAVQKAAVNTVRWEQAEESARAVISRIGELEADYLARKKGITLSLAYAQGFEDARNITFLQTKRGGLVFLR